MPIYEYHCDTCDERVAVLVLSRATNPSCPKCGDPLTDKLFSTPYVMSSKPGRPAGQTCCGQEERCDAPPCSGGAGCRRD